MPPEVRLTIAMIAAPPFAISFFWFAWTSYPSVSVWAPMMSGVLLGWSICFIFVRCFCLPCCWPTPYDNFKAWPIQLHHRCIFICRCLGAGCNHCSSQSIRCYFPCEWLNLPFAPADRSSPSFLLLKCMMALAQNGLRHYWVLSLWS